MSYRKIQWKQFRDGVIEMDGRKCTNCGRGEDEVTLQVHHKRYVVGRELWQYDTEDCVTLCKGCHAAEHGIIPPRSGWTYIDDEDLGDLIGTCGNCGTSIRYAFTVHHLQWGVMDVGTLCCDNLTDTFLASNKVESLKRYEGRLDRFKKSKKWKRDGNWLEIKHGLFIVRILEWKEKFYLEIHKLRSKKVYETLDSCKAAAFRAIESGDLQDYCIKKKIPITQRKREQIKCTVFTLDASRKK